MKVIGRVIALLWGGLIVASVLGTFAARSAKRRIVTVDAPDADEIRLSAIFEPLSFHSTAAKFRGGTVDCWYGGGVIDLRDTVLDPAGARIRVRAIFGGGQIVVPDAWRVDAKMVGLGGVGDARPKVDRDEHAPHLTIDGVAMFGGFAIQSEVPEAALRELREAVEKQARRRHGGETLANTPRVESA